MVVAGLFGKLNEITILSILQHFVLRVQNSWRGGFPFDSSDQWTFFRST